MKFAQHLDETAVAEWRSRYISYRALKKEIKKLAIVRERGRLTRGFSKQESSSRTPTLTPRSNPNSPRSIQQNAPRSPISPSYSERSQPDPQAQASKHGQSSRRGAKPESLAELDLGEPYKSLEGQRGADEAESDAEYSEDRKQSPSGEGSSDASSSAAIARPKPVASGLQSPSKQAASSNSPRSVFQINNFLRQRRGADRSSASTRSRDVNGKHSSGPTLDKLNEELSLLPKDEARFFALLDNEAVKVSDFYAEKELEACQRYKEIHRQLHQLQMHHPRQHHMRIHTQQSQAIGVLSALTEPITSAVKTSIDLVKTARTAQVSKPPHQTDVEEGNDEQHDEQHDAVPDYLPEITHDVPYKTARRRLKLAVFEYYRGLEMLKNFKLLNREGFYKILKKYDKATRRDMSALYMLKIMECNFVQSKKINRLITETEGLFARYFEGGSRKRAMDRLRVADRRPTHHWSSNRSGLYLGASIVLIIQGAVMSSQPQTQNEISAWALLLQVYGIFALPIIFALLVGINLVVWSNVRVNYAFIFELDVRTMLDIPQYFELPAFLFFLLSVAFYLSFLNPNPGVISPYYYPLIWFVVTLLLVLNPLRIGRYSARWWTLASFAKVVGSGLFFVDFKSFFLGDEWNSLAYSTYGLGVFVCSYTNRWGPNVEQQCNSNAHPVFFALGCLPAWFRFVQCWRRYYDTGAKVHIANAFKYLSTILFYTFLGVWRVNELNGNPSDQLKALFIVFACVYSLYTSSWDIFIDWAIGRPRSKNRFLRNNLLYPKWMYYVAMPIDVGIRFGWTVYLRDETVTLRARSFAYAAAEMARRFMWNFFRVEAEQQLNIGQYRANREVPLPYNIRSSRDSDDEGKEHGDDDEGKPDGLRRSAHESNDEQQRATRQVSTGQGTSLLQAATRFIGMKNRAQHGESNSSETVPAAPAEAAAASSVSPEHNMAEEDPDHMYAFKESDDRDVDSDLESGHAIGG